MSADNDWQTLVNIAHAQAVRGMSPLRPLTAFRNLGALLAERVSTQSQRPLLLEAGEGGANYERSYRDVEADATQLARHLQRLGVRRSDRIAVLSAGAGDVLLLYLAAWIIGASVVPLAADDDDRRLAANLQEASARLFVARAGLVGRARSIAAAGSGIVQPVVVHDMAAASSDMSGERAGLPEPARDDEALLAFTPDQYGVAGAMLNHYNLLATADSLARWNRWTPFDRIACSLPLSSVTGLVGALLAPLSAGASISVAAFDADTYWRHMQEMRATVSMLAPGHLRALVDATTEARPDGLRVRSVICAGGPVQADVVREFETRFGVPVLAAAGQPETSGWSFQMPLDAPAEVRRKASTTDGRACIGSPLDVNEAQVVDEAGKSVAQGQTGEIAIRGHNVMQGYHRRPDANRQAFATAWYRTGRAGSCQADSPEGQVFHLLAGRSVVAERDGVLLSLADVDRVLAEIPGVMQAVSVAFDNTHHGEEIGAYVMAEAGVHLAESAVVSYCRERLGVAKSPKVVVFGAPLAVDASGEVDRGSVRTLFARWLTARFDEPEQVPHAEGSNHER